MNHPMLGMLLHQATSAYRSGNLAQAESLYRAVLRLDSSQFDALHLLGLIAADKGDHAGAIGLIQNALTINPRFAPAHANLASSLRQAGQLNEALTSVNRALSLAPNSIEALNIKGNILRSQGQLAEALSCLRQAVSLEPTFVEAHDNLGNVLRDLGRLDEALKCYQDARQLAPNFASAAWNESLCRLLTGDFEHGWPLYEAGWAVGQRKPYHRFTHPRWNGQDSLHDKTILLYAEQGLGDTLQFSRYAKILAERGAQVILEVQPPLKKLLAASLPSVQVISTGEARPDFDCYSPLLSLPLACQTRLDTIPPPPPLRPPPEQLEQWHRRLGEKQRPRIGLAWSGNPALENDRNRSIPLEFFRMLKEFPADYICLQKEFREHDLECISDIFEGRLFAEHLHDFSDTAALVAQMDLVIAVDTAVAHLAASLGKETWILLPYMPDWRWLLGKEDSPWYPGARLLRQPESGNWSQVIQSQLLPMLQQHF